MSYKKCNDQMFFSVVLDQKKGPVYLILPFKHSLHRIFIFVSPTSHHKAFYFQLPCNYFMVRIRTYEKEIQYSNVALHPA